MSVGLSAARWQFDISETKGFRRLTRDGRKEQKMLKAVASNQRRSQKRKKEETLMSMSEDLFIFFFSAVTKWCSPGTALLPPHVASSHKASDNSGEKKAGGERTTRQEYEGDNSRLHVCECTCVCVCTFVCVRQPAVCNLKI